MPQEQFVQIQSVPQLGITKHCYLSNKNKLIVARGSLLQSFLIKDNFFAFQNSKQFGEKILEIFVHENNILLCTKNVALLFDPASLKEISAFRLTPPGGELFEAQRVLFAKTTRLLICFQDQQLIFIDLVTKQTQTTCFRVGTPIAASGRGEQFAVLASGGVAEPGHALHDARNLAPNYLAVFDAGGGRVTELARLTQLPSDAYDVSPTPEGFVVLTPKQFIFKNLNERRDCRFRFAALFEECDADIVYVQTCFETVFERRIEFNFQSLVQGKVINDLVNSQVLQKQLIHTVDQQRLPVPPKSLVPGHFQPRHADKYPYYGYYKQEINMKLNQVINIMGEYPVFDFMAETELGLNGSGQQFENLRYLGPLVEHSNYQQIHLLENVKITWVDDNKAIMVDKFGKFYSLIMSDDNIQLLPAFINEKDLPVYQRAGEISGLSLINAFNENNSFHVFCASYVNDSFINRIDFSNEIPDLNFYNDIREKGGCSTEQIHTQLLTEIQKNCTLISHQETTTQSKQQDELQTVEFFGKQKQMNIGILKQLYPWRYGLTGQTKQFFQNQVEQQTIHYSQTVHAVVHAVSVLVSTAGIVDLQQSSSTSNKSPKLHSLQYCGILQHIQQEVNVHDQSLIEDVQQSMQAIYDITAEDIVDDVQLLIMRKHSIDFAYLQFNQKTQKYIFNRQLTEQTRGDLYTTNDQEKKQVHKIILAAQRVRNKVVLVTSVGIEIYAANNKLAKCINLKNFGTQEERIVAAQITENIVTICCPRSIVVFALCYDSQNQLQVTDDVVILNDRCQKDIHFHSATFQEFYDCPLCFVSGDLINKQDEVDGYVIATTDQGVVFFIGVSLKNRTSVCYFASSNLLSDRNQNFEIHQQGDTPLRNEGRIKTGLFAGRCYPYVTFVNEEPYNFYIFVQMKNGDFAVYQFIDNYFKYLVSTSQGNTKLISNQEDRFAFFSKKDSFRYQTQSPFTKFYQDNCRCVFLGYPQITGASEPHSIVCVENLYGAFSFYNQGTSPSHLIFKDKQLTFDNMPPIRQIIDCKHGKYFCVTDYFNSDSKVSRIASCKGFNFGKICSAIPDVHKNFLKSLNLFNLSDLQYLASMSNNELNVKRELVSLPFLCQSMIYNRETDSFVIVAQSLRFEVRPTRNQTADEVANIRIYQAREQNDRSNINKLDEDKLVEFCHSLLQRDAPPHNVFSVLKHQIIYLLKDNLLQDAQSLKLCRMERVCCSLSEQLNSNYPKFFGKHWISYNTVQDSYGWEDRRMKNDDMENRRLILDKFECFQGKKELIFFGTGYTLGSFCRQYGQVLIYSVEKLDSNGLKIQQFQKSEFMKENKIVDKFLPNRAPKGDEMNKWQLNLVCIEEFQSAITGIQVMPDSECVLVGESKLIYGYLLTDGQKLERCTQEMGFGYILGMKRFADMLLIYDAFQDTKLYAYRNLGRRMTEITSISKENIGILGDFALNAFNSEKGELFVVLAFERGGAAIFSYRYDTDKVSQREQMELVQQLQVPETISSVIKIPQRVPKPGDQILQAGVCTVISTFEGSIIQVIPVPSQVCQIAGTIKSFIKTQGLLNYYDVGQRIGSQVTLDFSSVEQSDMFMILQKIYKMSGAF